ncbi:MAG: carbohydrate kinase family protein, partial [Verrucomicrobiaceae bacterium]
FTTRDIDFPTVGQSRIFHFGYPPLMEKMLASNGAEMVRLFRRVRRLGVATSLDMALPDSSGPGSNIDWQEVLARVLPCVDIFVPSIEEILFMLEPNEYNRLLAAAAGNDMVDMVPQDLFDHLAGQILSLGVRVLMIKSGHRGAYIRTGDISGLNDSTSLRLPVDNWSGRSLWAAPCPVVSGRIKNACGAGDCAVAGFLSAVLKGVEIEKAARYAMLAGRDNLYGSDAISGLRGWETMTRSIGHPARSPKK